VWTKEYRKDPEETVLIRNDNSSNDLSQQSKQESIVPNTAGYYEIEISDIILNNLIYDRLLVGIDMNDMSNVYKSTYEMRLKDA
jgi:hypothetical protein